MENDSFFLLYINSVLILLLMYLAGSFVWGLTKAAFHLEESDAWSTLFLKLSSGFFSLIVFTAVFYTQGKTVNSIFLPFYLYIIIKYIQYSGKKFFSGFFCKEEGQALGFSLIMLLLFGILTGVKTQYFFSGEISPRMLEDDYFYLAIAKFMPLLSLENTTPWYSLFSETPDYVRNPEAYHYGDLWMLAIALKTTFCSPVYTLRIVLQSVGMTLGWVGFVALFHRFADTKLSVWMIAILSFLLMTQWGYIPKNSGGPGTGFTVMLAWKGITGILMLQFSLMLFSFETFRKNQGYFFPLAALPVLNILFAPSVLGAMGLWGTFRMIYQKKIKEGIALFMSAGIFLWILSFYGLMSGFPDVKEGAGNSVFLTVQNAVAILRDFLFTAGDHFFHFFPVIAGFVLIYYNYKKIKEMSFLGILLLLMVISVLSGAVIHHHKESFQLSYITLWACNTMIYFTVFLIIADKNPSEGVRKRSLTAKIFLFLFFLQYLPGQYSKYLPKPMQEKDITSGTTAEFTEKVKNTLGDTRMIAYWNQREPEKGHMCNDCHFTGFIRTPLWVVAVNTPEAVSPDSDYAVRVTQTPLYSCILSLKKKNQYQDYPSAQIAFMRKYNLRFLLAPSGVIFPEEISTRIKDSITDKGSETRLYLLEL